MVATTGVELMGRVSIIQMLDEFAMLLRAHVNAQVGFGSQENQHHKARIVEMLEFQMAEIEAANW